MYWFQPETFVHPLNFYWNTYTITICSIGLIAATPIAPAINKKYLTLPVHHYGNIAICLFQSTACCLLLYLCAMELAAGTYNPFIYFRF
jgi:alginate O-acetyltransferase complex protein AlgI